ncbi:MAG: tetratricopeptide repeat protein [Bryobacteraceae bacterium]
MSGRGFNVIRVAVILLLLALQALPADLAEQAKNLAAKGVAAYRTGDFAAAQSSLRNALKADSKNMQARVYLARTLIAQNRAAEALGEIKQLMAIHPDDPEAQFQAGTLLKELAEVRFAELERLAPEASETHELRGRHFEAAGKLKEAIGEYRQALQKSPGAPGLHFLIGNAQWKLREYEAAKAELEAELKVNPHHTMANFRLGQTYLSLNDSERAIEYLQRAVENDGGHLEARRELGKALRQAGRNEEALEQLKTVAARRPEDDSVHAQLAAVYRSLGDMESARREMEVHREILRKRHEQTRRNFEEGRKK